MKKTTLLLLAILVQLTVFACECEALKPLSKAETDAYEFIFTGKVVDVQQFDENGLAKFEIQAIYKGKSYSQTSVSFDNLTDCQMSFSTNEVWIIYANYKEYGKPELVFCSRSRKLNADPSLDKDVLGISFTAELDWLKKNLGIQAFNEKKETKESERKLILPTGLERLWLYLGGLVVLVGIWLLVRKLLN
jgi:hypothetical protein